MRSSPTTRCTAPRHIPRDRRVAEVSRAHHRRVEPADDARTSPRPSRPRAHYPQLVVGHLARQRAALQRAAAIRGARGRHRERAHAEPRRGAVRRASPFTSTTSPRPPRCCGQLDFLLVNVHPVFQPWFRDAPDSAAAQFVVNVLAQLAPLACGPILVKETGVPTAPASAGFSEARQASFYRELAPAAAAGPAHAHSPTSPRSMRRGARTMRPACPAPRRPASRRGALGAVRRRAPPEARGARAAAAAR